MPNRINCARAYPTAILLSQPSSDYNAFRVLQNSMNRKSFGSLNVIQRPLNFFVKKFKESDFEYSTLKLKWNSKNFVSDFALQNHMALSTNSLFKSSIARKKVLYYRVMSLTNHPLKMFLKISKCKNCFSEPQFGFLNGKRRFISVCRILIRSNTKYS